MAINKKYQVFKWIAIVLAIILAVGICGSVISLVQHKDNSVDKGYVTDVVATFNFGENRIQEGSDSLHSDGSAAKENLEFISGNHKLVLTDFSSVYVNAFDAMGNSCLKLGTATATASFKFTVSSDVTSVVVYVAGYKDNTAKISINLGNIQVIESLSNEGEYTAIQITVPSNREITFATATGGTRAMIDRIEFIGKVRA